MVVLLICTAGLAALFAPLFAFVPSLGLLLEVLATYSCGSLGSAFFGGIPGAIIGGLMGLFLSSAYVNGMRQVLRRS